MRNPIQTIWWLQIFQVIFKKLIFLLFPPLYGTIVKKEVSKK